MKRWMIILGVIIPGLLYASSNNPYNLDRKWEGPMIDIDSIYYADPVPPNPASCFAPDGNISMSEITDLSVNLRNAVNVDAYNSTAILECTHISITVHDTAGIYGVRGLSGPGKETV